MDSVILRECKLRAGLPDDGLLPPLLDWIRETRQRVTELEDALAREAEWRRAAIKTAKAIALHEGARKMFDHLDNGGRLEGTTNMLESEIEKLVEGVVRC